MDVIYRCGWCGRPVKEDGGSLDINYEADANQYMLEHKDAEEVQVQGYCCPNGDGGDYYGW
jgi:hypothetical protein